LAELGQDIGFAPRDAREQCASDTSTAALELVGLI
jgi:hypothetical protein